jgi:hypothetical protein
MDAPIIFSAGGGSQQLALTDIATRGETSSWAPPVGWAGLVVIAHITHLLRLVSRIFPSDGLLAKLNMTLRARLVVAPKSSSEKREDE